MDSLNECKHLLERTRNKVTSSVQNWMDFLKFSARIYKYDFISALLIYSKRPDATALASEEIWKRVGRFITTYAEKIPILVDTKSQVRLEYVYDVSDTGGNQNSSPKPWTLKPEYKEAVLTDLEERYGLRNKNFPFPIRLQNIIETIVQECSEQYFEDILEYCPGTPLEHLSDTEIDGMVHEFLSDCITLMVFHRIDKASNVLNSLIFDDLPLLNDPQLMTILGTGAVEESGTLLRQIESSVKQIQHEEFLRQRRSRNVSHVQRKAQSTISPSGSHAAEVREAADKIRDNLQELSERDAAGPVRGSDGKSGAYENLSRERGRSQSIRGNSPLPAPQGEPAAESGRYQRNDSVQQLALQDGRGYDDRGYHSSQTLTDKGGTSPSAGNAPSLLSPSLNGKPEYNAFISEQDFRDIYFFTALIHIDDTRRESIVQFFQKGCKSQENIAFLKKLIGTCGRSLEYPNGVSGFSDYSPKGLRITAWLPEGDYSRTVTWNVIQKEIRALIVEGRFLSATPAQQSEQLSFFGTYTAEQPILVDGKAPAAPSSAQPVESSETPAVPLKAPTDQVPEGLEEFLDINPEAIKRRLNSPEQQKHVDDMLKFAESVYKESRKNLPATNFQYSDSSEITGGQKTHYKLNIEAIHVLKDVESEERWADSEEQRVLSKYVGWGGISQAFDKDNKNWSDEYEELKKLLTPEEYEAARASTLTAFYTPPAVIQAVHTALQNFGFKGGNILDPACGICRFFGYLPDQAKYSSKLFGVELDNLSGRIAQQLYQEAHIQIRAFEKAAFPDNFFDVAVGNVPFGEFKVPDRRYDKQNFLIHDYFFAKTLDKVRPGGLIAFVTSKGTMDKANPAVRRYIAQRAELIGAIRLPNTMMKVEANTDVTADLIFLQKRERMVDIEPEWVSLTYLDGQIPINTYFADHPEMMLGTMAFDNRMYGNNKETTLNPKPDIDWRDELPAAIEDLHAEYAEQIFDVDSAETAVSIPADPSVKNFSYTVSKESGMIYYRENSRMVLEKFTGNRDHRIRGLVEIRDAMREAIRVQSNDYPDKAVKETQDVLNRLYDKFVRKYGAVTSTGNRLAFHSDSDYPLLCSLENIDDDGSVTKAAIFTKRTIRPPLVITHLDTAVEALPHSLNQKGCVDIPFIAGLTGKTEEQVLQDLTGVIFKDPVDGNFQTADEYLSGNVRSKLRIAREFSEKAPAYRANVEALEKVQPKDLDASQIDVRLGSPLPETDDIRQFITDLLKPTGYAENFKVIYIPSEALWKIAGISHSRATSDITASKTYGTHRIDGYDLIELSLNQKSPTIRDRQADDTYVVNTKETAAAREKQKVIEQKFEEWIFKDHDRRERLVRKYNEIYNNTRLRQYDGSYLTFPGMTPDITLRTHQKNAVARTISSGNTLYAHCVGAGKTYTMTAAGMECKRLGLCNKNMFVVPGHLIDQWGQDILRLYPGANVLLATKQDFERSKRQRLISRIATGDYDAVVIANTSFEKIPVSPERRERIIRSQINEVTEAMELAQTESDEDWTVKQMERTKKSLETQLERLSDQSRKDNLLTFEELGIDQLFVDEAHYYKNLFIATKMTNVAGISASHSLKSTDLLMKCEYINEINHGPRGVNFATGTPVSNSMSELFVMMRYLEFARLEEMGFHHFDAWAAQFGRKVSSLELTPDGTQYRYKTRFAEFVNLPELMTLYSQVADIQTADQLQLPVPRHKTGKPIIVVAKPSADQQELVKDIIACFERIHNGSVDPSEDNALKETSRGRLGALDMRALDPVYDDFEGSKINLAVKNIFGIWKESTPKLGTQMVFCDLSTPSATTVNMEMKDGVATMTSVKFSVYYDIKVKLINLGIPAEQIAFIHDAKTEKRKEQIFSDMRSGKLRILLGSTSRMGAGTNAQRKIIAIHHIDCPWRPGDLEQRNGRAYRQGNENEEVGEYRYVTEGTFDAYSWQILEQKQRFISQVSTGRCVERHAQDIDDTVLDYATVKMLSTKDPRIKEREELRVRVAELNALKAQFNSEKYMMEDDLYKFEPQRVAQNGQAMHNLEHDISVRDSNTKEDFEIELLGNEYTKRQIAGEIIVQKANGFRKDGESLPIGMYRGFRLDLTYSAFNHTHAVVLVGSARYTTEIGDNALGCIARLDNTLGDLDKRLSHCKGEITTAQQRMDDLDKQLKIPWDHEVELADKNVRLNKLDIELSNEIGSDKEAVLTNEMENGTQEEEAESTMNLGM